MENKSRQNAETATAKLLDLWQSDELPGMIARSVIERKADPTAKPSNDWSLGNYILMLLAGTSDARGYRQWEAAGRQVKKGSKAFHILGPCIRKVTEKDKATGLENERQILVGFKAIPVFAVEDTEGDPLPDATQAPDYDPPARPPLHEVAAAWGIDVRYTPYSGAEYGSYRPWGKEEIRLATHDELTFWHELAHAAHNRIKPGGLKGGQIASQEIVAEASAAALALVYGVELRQVAAARDYVKFYGKDDAPKAAVRHLAEIQKVLTLILDTAEELAGTVEATAGAA